MVNKIITYKKIVEITKNTDYELVTSGKVQNYIQEKFGIPWTVAEGCEHPGDGYNLSYINKL